VIALDASRLVTEIALWMALAFGLWLLLTAALNRLGVHAAPLIAAPISWVVARAIMSGIPELIHWAQHRVTTMTG
jgi:hypothetical protein